MREIKNEYLVRKKSNGKESSCDRDRRGISGWK